MAPKKRPAAAMAVPAARRSKPRSREVRPVEDGVVPGGGSAVSENPSTLEAALPSGGSAVSENASTVERALVPGGGSAVSENALEMEEAMPSGARTVKAKALPHRRKLVYKEPEAAEALQPEEQLELEEARTPSVGAETLLLGGLSPPLLPEGGTMTSPADNIPQDVGHGDKFEETVGAIMNEAPNTDLIAPSASINTKQDPTSCKQPAAGLQREPACATATSNEKDRFSAACVRKT